jgi:hypothetical protein
LAEPQIVNREELNFLLSETSGLEYMVMLVMLAHLFAAFSLKTDVRSDAVRSVRDRLFSLRRGRGVLRSSGIKESRDPYGPRPFAWSIIPALGLVCLTPKLVDSCMRSPL